MNERSMFYGAKPNTFAYASKLREQMTKAEKILWARLQKNQLKGLRFKSQHPIGSFIADFYCHKLKLVIEVDGDIHLVPENMEYDINRTAEIEKFGITLIRFTNVQIINNIEQTIKEIEKKCDEIEQSSLPGGITPTP